MVAAATIFSEALAMCLDRAAKDLSTSPTLVVLSNSVVAKTCFVFDAPISLAVGDDDGTRGAEAKITGDDGAVTVSDSRRQHPKKPVDDVPPLFNRRCRASGSQRSSTNFRTSGKKASMVVLHTFM